VLNGLGLAVHFFFSLTLGAEAIALIFLFGHEVKQTPLKKMRKSWGSLALVALGTATTGLVWLWMVIPKGFGNGMTDWIRNDSLSVLALISPVFQLLAAWITMLSLLPVESPSLVIMIISALVMLLFFIWVIPLLNWGLQISWEETDSRLPIRMFLWFLAGVLIIFLSTTYLLGIDITRGARYSFVYFPAVIVVLGASFAVCWRKDVVPQSLFLKNFTFSVLGGKSAGKKAVIAIWLMGFLSAITVVSNLGYQKYYRPDLLVPIMAEKSSVPLLIATTHKSLVQTGEMMGLAVELQKHPLGRQPSFLLVNQPSKNSPLTTVTLQKAVNQLPHPLDVWTINFQAPVELNNCVADSQPSKFINGYGYQLYHCSI
jgi:uncharacterized membrane protein